MHQRLPSLLAALALLPGLALAHGPSPHGHGRPHARSSVHFGVAIGSGFYSPGYPGFYPNYWYGPSINYSVPVYTAPSILIQTQPPVYIEQPAVTADAVASAYWYYCAPTQSYYPYVSECAQTWQRVAPVPPSVTQP